MKQKGNSLPSFSKKKKKEKRGHLGCGGWDSLGIPNSILHSRVIVKLITHKGDHNQCSFRNVSKEPLIALKNIHSPSPALFWRPLKSVIWPWESLCFISFLHSSPQNTICFSILQNQEWRLRTLSRRCSWHVNPDSLTPGPSCPSRLRWHWDRTINWEKRHRWRTRAKTKPSDLRVKVK